MPASQDNIQVAIHVKVTPGRRAIADSRQTTGCLAENACLVAIQAAEIRIQGIRTQQQQVQAAVAIIITPGSAAGLHITQIHAGIEAEGIHTARGNGDIHHGAVGQRPIRKQIGKAI